MEHTFKRYYADSVVGISISVDACSLRPRLKKEKKLPAGRTIEGAIESLCTLRTTGKRQKTFKD